MREPDALLLTDAARHRRVQAEHVTHGLGAVDGDEHALLDIYPRSTRLLSSVVATVAFSVEPSHSPSGA